MRRCLVVMLLVLGLLAVAAPSEASTRSVQRRLNDLGCHVGPVDGVLGDWTRAGIIRLQAANHLTQTGRLGPLTRRTLRADRQVRCDRRPVPGSSTGRRVVVSQKQNYVWLVRRGGHVVAQGGIVDNPSYLRAGTYRSGSKCGRAARIYDNTDASGRLRLHHFVRFAPCGIGFHQIPQYRSNLAQIHSAHLLGTNLRASHGCIRVSRTMSGHIWDFVRVGTKVVVLGG